MTRVTISKEKQLIFWTLIANFSATAYHAYSRYTNPDEKTESSMSGADGALSVLLLQTRLPKRLG
ncbi:uncharacterized protein METZ01_LOCUS36406 [marine metagenome]|uniref:Uncharacterized protein n=1 Tax=marine metagenome TaxID=408172 RepID=A0A381QVU7_9ZZZZ